jgi:hypothetical protein
LACKNAVNSRHNGEGGTEPEAKHSFPENCEAASGKPSGTRIYDIDSGSKAQLAPFTGQSSQVECRHDTKTRARTEVAGSTTIVAGSSTCKAGCAHDNVREFPFMFELSIQSEAIH